MKWSDLEKGTNEGRVTPFEIPGGKTIDVRIVPLLAFTDGEIERAADAYAKANGAPAVAGNPTYERGVYAHTIFRSCLDPSDGKPLFASAEQIIAELDRDRIAYLFECQQQVQAAFAPRAGKLNPLQYFDWIMQTAEAEEGADLPFERSPRATQLAYHIGIALAYVHLHSETKALAAELLRLQSLASSAEDKSSLTPGSPATAPNSGDFASNAPSQSPAEGNA